MTEAVNEKFLREAIDRLSETLTFVVLAGMDEVECGHDICCYGALTEASVGYGLALEDLLDGLKELMGEDKDGYK